MERGNLQAILVKSEQEVQPPVNIGHIQWRDVHGRRGTRVCHRMTNSGRGGRRLC